MARLGRTQDRGGRPAQRPRRRPALRLLRRRRGPRRRRAGAASRRAPGDPRVRRRCAAPTAAARADRHVRGARARRCVAARRSTRSRPPRPRWPAFAAAGARLRRTPEQAARALLDARRRRRSPRPSPRRRAPTTSARDVPVVALGGAGAGAGGRGGARARPPAAGARAPRDPVVDRRGAVARARRDRPPLPAAPATALRAGPRGRARVRRRPAPRRRRCASRRASRPATGLLRAVATGAVALESGAAEPRAGRRGRPAARGGRARSGIDAGDGCSSSPQRLLPRVLRERRAARWRSSTASARSRWPSTPSASIAERRGRRCSRRCAQAVDDGAVNLGVATLLPRGRDRLRPAHRRPVRGARARRTSSPAPRGVLDGQDGPAVAVIWS